jgi:hypothetical protein
LVEPSALLQLKLAAKAGARLLDIPAYTWRYGVLIYSSTRFHRALLAACSQIKLEISSVTNASTN